MKQHWIGLRTISSLVMETLWGCGHVRVTRPFTIEHATYKVCLDCGKHIHYSAAEMRPLTAREIQRLNDLPDGGLVAVPSRAA